MFDFAAAMERLHQLGGSDLLVSAGTPARIRCDGSLRLLDDQVLTATDSEQLLRSLLSADQWAEFQACSHVDFAFTWGKGARIRANAYRQRDSLAAAFRLLPLEIPSLGALGIPEVVQQMISRLQGLVLVTGPTGSGKSTTLASMVDTINATVPCHVVTIEDPIEYVHRHKVAVVDQRQVGSDVPSFAAALRVVFREDPDVVLIGEMRDPETISAALTIAETGHLVLATLHTNDASQAIDRVVDAVPAGAQEQARTQLAACLSGVVYQRLLPAQRGGRVAAFEVLMATPAVRALIKAHKTNQIRNVIQTSLRDGSQTLERSLSELVTAGVVDPDEARARSLYPEEISA
jgi:twitching motility protein PilT